MPSPQKKREQLKMQRQQQEQEKLKQWREDYDRLQQAEKEGKKIYKAAGGRIRATSEEELKQKTSKAAKSAVDAELTMVKLRSQEAVKKLKKDRKRKDLSTDTQRQEQRSMRQRQQGGSWSTQRASLQDTRRRMGPKMPQKQTPYAKKLETRESMFDRAFGTKARVKKTNRRASR